MSDTETDLRKWRLPRGRHGLPRELVTRSQRERLLASVVRVTAAKGYEATTVADILEEAGVGRESFYELFEDKRDCMLAAHRILIEDLEARVRDAYAEPGEWPGRLEAAMDATLGWFAADPTTSRFTLVELGAVDTVFRSRVRSIFESFVEIVDGGLADGGPKPELHGATRLAVAAIMTTVYEQVVLGRAAELPTLRGDLSFELLVPYIGEEAATERRRRLAG
ncbi:MAG: TetR/AcrR family transcriptional regulator [Solirubrobacterales bacterium]